ncbi:MAG: hypothetical protein EBS42_11060 [Caulobacteraceae bacterium]|nr:hypothetical protein [Caulobacteraceae bacterium]
MKRYGNLFEKIVNFENLILGSKLALRGGKRLKAAHFYFHLETELFQLEEELQSGTYRPCPYRVFEIFEPKRRVISAADIRDRVVHHAICRVLEPIFERIGRAAEVPVLGDKECAAVTIRAKITGWKPHRLGPAKVMIEFNGKRPITGEDEPCPISASLLLDGGDDPGRFHHPPHGRDQDRGRIRPTVRRPL